MWTSIAATAALFTVWIFVAIGGADKS